MRFKLLFTAFTFIVFNSWSQVVINEYTAANYNNYQDNYNEYEDWVEFYNPTTGNIDLNGYYLSDKDNNLTKWQFTGSFIVPANGHAVVFFSGRDELAGEAHTSYKLHQTKGNEWIILTNPNGTTVEDSVWVKRCQANHSRGRDINGSNNWGVFDTPTPNANNINSFLGYAEKPVFSLTGGYYTGSANINLSSNSTTNTIYYTDNGDFPTNASNLYTNQLTFNNTTILKARCYSSNPQILPGFIEYHTYFINDNHTLPIISISGSDVDNLLGGNQWIEPFGTFEIFDANGQLIDKNRGQYNKHGNDSWAYPQRGFDYIVRDQLGYGHEVEGQIFRDKNRDGFQRLIVKAASNDNYPFSYGGSGAHVRDPYCNSLSQVADLRVDERTHEPCILYLNGEYWGVYDYREKVDDIDFTDHYYDQDDGYVDFIKTWGGTWIEYGTDTGWVNIRNFILNNDMSIQANYDHAKKYLNVGSLIDYYLLNVYTVNADWLNWNTAWWRGRDLDGDKKKWRYALWDFDNTFDHGANYTGIPNTDPDADPCDPEGMGNVGGQGHVPILNALFDSEEFTADYINRWADLGNTYFSCDFMISHLDSLIAMIEPEMPRQINTWGGSYADWQNNVDDLRDFILDRCTEINAGIVDCYDVTGPFTVTIIIDGIGEVQFSDININEINSGWSGLYFGDIEIPIEVTSGNFSFWEIVSNTTYNYDPFSQDLDINLNSDITIIAHFDANTITYMVNPIGQANISENGNIVNGFPFDVSYVNNTVVNLSALPSIGWQVDYWSSNNHTFTPNPSSNNVSFTVNSTDTVWLHVEPIVVTATIETAPENSNGEVYIDGNIINNFPHVVSYNYGSTVTISANSTPYWEFDYWTSNYFVPNGTVSTDYSFNITNHDTIVAHFNELVYHDIELNCKPENAGILSIDGNVPPFLPETYSFLENTVTPISATPNNGYRFVEWTSNNLEIQPNSQQNGAFIIVSESDILTAHFEEIFEVFVPNSFTPNNGDYDNNIFQVSIFTENEYLFNIKIFNRWGQFINESTDALNAWDGTNAKTGAQVPDGIYTYILNVSIPSTEKQYEKKGSITIVR